MPKIHPTAVVDPAAKIADEAEIGPYCIIEADVEIGPKCVLREGVIVRQYTSMGERNYVDAQTVLGGLPQDLKFDKSIVSYLRIGNENTFREGVTISRASQPGQATVVGNRCYWMAHSHAGHDVVVQDQAVLVNGALVGGHARIGSKAFLSGHVIVHQFTWVGEGVMSRGNAGVSAHVPPYTLFVDINRIAGLNVVGMRRDEQMTFEDRKQIKEAFRLTYRAGLSAERALEEMDKCADWGSFAGKFREFVREAISAEPPYDRGLCPMRVRTYE